jgi:hypothetical protein
MPTSIIINTSSFVSAVSQHHPDPRAKFRLMNFLQFFAVFLCFSLTSAFPCHQRLSRKYEATTCFFGLAGDVHAETVNGSFDGDVLAETVNGEIDEDLLIGQRNLRFSGVGKLYTGTTPDDSKVTDTEPHIAVVERLTASTVLIVGLGGVGSWSAESLCRSGVGHLILIDLDDICIR